MNGSILVSLSFSLLFAYVVYASLDYAYLARLFPLYAGLTGLIFSIVNLGQDVWRSYRNIAQDSGMGLSDLEADWDIPHTVVWQRAGRLISTFVILYIGIWLVGYPIAMSAFVALFYRFSVRARWIYACVAGGAALGFIACVANLLNMTWPEGLISKFIALPWPLG